MSDKGTYDVAIVGGGPTGLSAAVTLARSLRSVIVVDAGNPRNAPAHSAHNVLAREGASPQELLAAGRSEAETYGAEIVDDRVTAADRYDEGFQLRLADRGEVRVRRLLLATGLVDDLPDVAGLRELWGKSVLHCPYCHGWEVRGQRIGVLATNDRSVHQAHLFRQLSDHVTFFAHTMADLNDEVCAEFAARDIRVEDGVVVRLRVENGVLSSVVLDGGDEVIVDALAVAPRFVARTDLYEQLGGKITEHHFGAFVPADQTGHTDVPGVYAAGNVTDLGAMVAGAMGNGVLVAAAINADLVAEEVGAAVRERSGIPRADRSTDDTRTFWESFYGERRQVWSGKPNDVLVRLVADLTPGAALDLGCGEGADAIFLAKRGWRVTAVDIAQTALDRAAAHARDAGVEERIVFQHRDLATSLPVDRFDLVSAQYLHSPVELPRDEILRRAAEVVAPGGRLLVTGHAGMPHEADHTRSAVHYPSAEALLDALNLPDEWSVEVIESIPRSVTVAGSDRAEVLDAVVMLRRPLDAGQAQTGTRTPFRSLADQQI